MIGCVMVNWAGGDSRYATT